LAFDQKNGRYVAIKIVSRDSAGFVSVTYRRPTLSFSRLQTELLIHRNVSHPNIIRLHDVLEDASYHYMVMEFAAGGELFDKIRAFRGPKRWLISP
jgi:serine/threonine-protein kinase Chk1